MANILLIEDNAFLSETVTDWLSAENHHVEAVTDGQEGLSRLSFYQYDLIIVDWELPFVSGIDIVKHYRSSGGVAPVLMLTGRSKVEDKEVGLDSGTDDYLTKPFDMRELSARVRALLRRSPVFQGELLKRGDIELDPVACKVSRNHEEINLAPREFALLEFFMRNPNRVFSTEALIERVWHGDETATIEGVRASVRRLRKALNIEGDSFICTVHGLGYRLESA